MDFYNLYRNSDCKGKIIDFSPAFRQLTILIIASVENGKIIEPQEIPQQINVVDERYYNYLGKLIKYFFNFLHYYKNNSKVIL